MGAFYFITSVILFFMQLIAGAWFLRCYPQMGWKVPLLFSLIGTALMLAGLALTRIYQEGLFWTGLYYVAHTYLGFVFLAFCFCAGFYLLSLLLTLLRVPTGWMGLVSLLTLAVLFALSLWGGFKPPQVKHISLQIPSAPKMKLALLSDTHLGMGVSLNRFDKVMQQIEAESPDALLVLGDIFEYGPHREQYAARLAQAQTPLGSYGVLGNHEYYVGYEKSKQFFEQAGVKLLENDSAVLPNGVQVAGLKDIHTAHVTAQDVTRVLAPLNKNAPIILLSHTPALAETAGTHGVDLMLSGHTHNGQLWPFTYLVKLKFPRAYGLHTVDDMKFYITSGVFYWGVPLRLFSPAELVFIEVNP